MNENIKRKTCDRCDHFKTAEECGAIGRSGRASHKYWCVDVGIPVSTRDNARPFFCRIFNR